jgi:N-acetylmuramoyl-L-alanine amidase
MKAVLTRVLAVAISLSPALVAAQPRIVIDPGHGGTDPGGVGNGLQEKNVVLDVAKRFKALVDRDTADTRGGGRWVSLLTRSTDVFVSLSARTSFSNNQDADRFMSIHSNAFSDPAAHGTETFTFFDTGTGANLRNVVQSEMIAAWGLTNRGVKVANFAVLRDTAAPAELHELAFITNSTDVTHLASATERQKAAVAHLRALQRHFGITPFLPAASTPAGTSEPVGDEPGPVVPDGEPEAPPEAPDAPGSTEPAGCSSSSGASGAFTALALVCLASMARRRRR